MVKKINSSRIIVLSLLTALLLAFSIYPSNHASAAEFKIQNPIPVNNIGKLSVNPSSYYVTVNKTFNSFPPGTIYHSEMRGSFLYGGNLSLFDYAKEGEFNVYYAVYKGYIYAK
ncbi:hypothetical protein ABNX05_04950 [Lysinibacillus sp. M3]|uniref:Uncharacterized protein n=1 Tax=Lysinibacillus zambalensis TaxID=3160866 RepID=A0ABV1MN77_9BACI